MQDVFIRKRKIGFRLSKFCIFLFFTLPLKILFCLTVKFLQQQIAARQQVETEKKAPSASGKTYSRVK